MQVYTYLHILTDPDAGLCEDRIGAGKKGLLWSLRLMDDQGGCIIVRAYPLLMGKVSKTRCATRIINSDSWKRNQIYSQVHFEKYALFNRVPRRADNRN